MMKFITVDTAYDADNDDYVYCLGGGGPDGDRPESYAYCKGDRILPFEAYQEPAADAVTGEQTSVWRVAQLGDAEQFRYRRHSFNFDQFKLFDPSAFPSLKERLREILHEWNGHFRAPAMKVARVILD